MEEALSTAWLQRADRQFQERVAAGDTLTPFERRQWFAMLAELERRELAERDVLGQVYEARCRRTAA